MLHYKALISLGLCAATLAISTPVLAQERTVKVIVSDLDLAGPSGQKELQNRVTRAARIVCNTNGSRSAREHVQAKECEAQVMANAEPKVAERIAQQNGNRSVAIRSDIKLAAD